MWVTGEKYRKGQRKGMGRLGVRVRSSDGDGRGGYICTVPYKYTCPSPHARHHICVDSFLQFGRKLGKLKKYINR